MSRRRAGLRRETRILQRLWWVEAGAAGILILIGALMAWAGHGYGWLIGGLALGFLAASHAIKFRQNVQEERAMDAGLRGENQMARLLNENLDNDYYLFHDIKVRSGFSTAQIDHLVVSPKGIFAIETKNWRGHLSGDEDGRTWLQTKAPDEPARSLSNPVLQARRHAAILEKFLRSGGVPPAPIISLIVFTGRDTTLDIKHSRALLMWPREAVDYILRYQNKSPLSAEAVDKILHRLQTCL